MKRLFLLFFTLFLMAGVYAQAPQKINYQAVVRNANNFLVENQNVSARITVLQGSATGSVVYVEVHNAITNANGLLTLEIGGGSVVYNSFNAIDWSAGPFFLKSEIDPEGGSNYSLITTQQLMSVPYALYAAASGNGEGPQGPAGPQGPQGEPGTPGPQGPQGLLGAPGANGVSPYITTTTTSAGTNVTITDANGTHQVLVPNGADGATGAQGSQGPAGPQGPVGSQGPQGVQGPAGSQGEPGAVGPQGPQGAPGAQGISPTITTTTTNAGTYVNITDGDGNHSFFIPNGTDGTAGLQGPQGQTGASGAAGNAGPVGPQGEPGVSPVVSIQTIPNGNRVIVTSATSVDTFLVLNGESGPQGPQGEPGPQGPQGLPGLQGESGPQGGPGIPGAQGEPGPAGFSPVVTITPLDALRTQVTITSAAYPDGQNFIVKNGISTGDFVQAQSNWLETDTTANSYIQNKPDLFDGDYSHLTNTPTLAPVSITGSYTDLVDKPTIPAVANDAALVLQKNGTTIGTFTANAAVDDTINITVPTATSDLVNDIGLITTAEVPTRLSQLDNDANYVNNSDCPSINFCDLYEAMTDLQNMMDSTQEDVNGRITVFLDSLNGVLEDMQDSLENRDSILYELYEELYRFTCGISKVRDHEGNVYNTVPIGNQCWTKENMRATTSPSTGTNLLSLSAESYSFSGKKAYYVKGSADSSMVYGLLYNWNAAVDTFNTLLGEESASISENDGMNVDFTGFRRGICPYGWHVPSQEEWMHMTSFVGSQQSYVCGNDSINIGKALASSRGWSNSLTDCALGHNPNENNATGFSALPSGWVLFQGGYGYFGTTIAFWSTNNYGISHFIAYLDYDTPYMQTNGSYAASGFSVRCLRDAGVGGALADNESDDMGGETPPETVLTVPTVMTVSVTNITETSAVSGGDVVADGGASVTARGVCWSTTQNPTVADAHTVDGAGLGSFISTITGLTAGTTYYVRAYATNSEGTAYGEELYFSTSATLPTVMTASVTNITETSAVSGGEVTSDGGASVTARGICWSTTPNPTVADAHTTDGAGLGSFTSTITGLAAGTTYYVRAYATNSEGTAYGNQVHFSIEAVNAPSVTTGEVSDVTATTAICGGVVTNDGGASVTARGVCWSTTPNPTVADAHTTDGAGLGSFTSTITGLSAGTTYYVRAYATNSEGTTYGEELYFSTSATLPTVTTVPVMDITETSAVSGGNVAADGGAAVTARGICWSTSQHPTVADAHTVDGAGLGSFTSTITGLSAGTTYYVRAYATNSEGTAYGNQVLFSIESVNAPSVTTGEVTDVMATTALCGGDVTDDGGAAVTARGVCWSTSQHPTVADAHTTDGAGLGSFTSTITGLSAGTTYYVRAYATNSEGTAYGNQVHFSIEAVNAPSVTTGEVSDVTATTAICGGVVTNDGGASVTVRGVCWSTVQDPTIADAHTTDGTGLGTFSSSLTGLASRTIYYVRAYAINRVDTVYGQQKRFLTDGVGRNPNDGQPCDSMPTITDHEGNVYNTVQVGTQCWTKENMRATTSPTTGAYLVRHDMPNNSNYSYSGKQARWYNNDSTTYAPMGYGLLYNWNAAMDTFKIAYSYDELSVSTRTVHALNFTFDGFRRGICPEGWHVPNDVEWDTLTNYVGRFLDYICDIDSADVNKALAATYGWNSSTNSCVPGSNLSDNNATGFSAVPSGCYEAEYGYLGSRAYFWSATQSLLYRNCAYNRHFASNNHHVARNNANKYMGYAVRCISDATGVANVAPERDATKPTVTTDTISEVTPTTAICGGVVTDDGGAPVTERGVCWSTSPNPTVSDAHTVDGAGPGSFTSSLTGLTPSTAYYVRAYAINEVDIAYGARYSFLTDGVGRNPNDGQPCDGMPTVTDHEGNVYNTVQVGTQCWTKENMRATTSPTTGIYLVRSDAPSSSNYTYSGKLARWYDNDSTTYAPQGYGLLYNWNAAMDTFNIAYSYDELSMGNSSNNSFKLYFDGFRRGICPAGWHLPNDVEWDTLINYVGRYSEYLCNLEHTDVAKALSSTYDWNSSTNSCVPGRNMSDNNATGFTALPSGRYEAEYGYMGNRVYFWSATQSQLYKYSAYNRHFTNSSSHLTRSSADKNEGYAVRCVSDATGIASVAPEIVATPPRVTTAEVADITGYTATCGGVVTDDGGASVTARGVCWSTSPNPTVADAHTIDGTGLGSFVSSLAGLTPSTTYYVRAYAINSVDTVYGSRVFFISAGIGRNPNDGEPCFNMPTVTDHEGNVYNTVQVGTQCWTKENMRATTSPTTGAYLVRSDAPSSSNYTYSGKQARWYSNDSTTYAPQGYGLLYNWNAAMDTFNIVYSYDELSISTNTSKSFMCYYNGFRRGVCPQGWHLPNNAEWDTLTNYVGRYSEYLCNSHSDYISKALASTQGWNSSTSSCYPGNNPSSNNATGFSALPAGYCDNSFHNLGSYTYFWSATQSNTTYRSSRYGLSNSNTINNSNNAGKNNEYSVRCVSDVTGIASDSPEIAASKPTVTTANVTDITANTAVCGGAVTSNGGASVTARGVCWSTSSSPTVEDAHTTDGTGLGSFNSFITGLAPSTTYYIRAYATNREGTAYGNSVTIRTDGTGQNPNDGQPCEGMPTVTDHQGNVYNTVQVGTQCWTKENMRATTSPTTGAYLVRNDAPSSSNYSCSGKQARWYDNDSTTYAAMGYGLLYNWNAALDTFNTAYDELSINSNASLNVTFYGFRRGICPQGWHVPNSAEWDTLADYVGRYSAYIFNNRNDYIAKALASTQGWNSSSSDGYPGNNPSANNATGFSAVPAGCYDSEFNYLGNRAYFWRVDQQSTSYAQTRYLSYNGYGFTKGNNVEKYKGYPVRCLRD